MLQNLLTGTGSKEKIIFKNGAQEITWGEFLTDIAALTATLSTTPHQRWALCYTDAYLFTVSLLAVLKSKGCPVLLPNNNPGTIKLLQKEFDALLADSVDTSDFLEKCANVVLSTRFACKLWRCDDVTESRSCPSCDGSIIFFTSGSAGAPKKIARSLRQTLDEVKTLEATFGSMISAGAEVYATVSHQHIYGILFYIFWSLYADRTIHFPPLAYPENIAALLTQDQPVILISSPALLARMSPAQITNQRVTIFSSGGKLSGTAINSCNIIDVLGSTETGGVAFRKLGEDSWTPFPKVHIAVDAETQCLKISSPLCDADNWVMGDRAIINADGTFQLLERADRIAKIEGKRVSLLEIETMLKQHHAVKDAYVIAMEMETTASTHRQYTAALLVLTDWGKEFLERHGRRALNLELKKQLAHYFEPIIVPKRFRYVDALPCNAQGKIVLDEARKVFAAS